MQAVLLLSWVFFLHKNFVLVVVVVAFVFNGICLQIFVICTVFVTQYVHGIGIKPAMFEQITLILQKYMHSAEM